MNNKLLGLVVILFVAVTGLMTSFFIIDEREQALVVRFGEPKATVREPGIYFKVPFIDNVVEFDKRILSLDVRPQEVLASDSQRILVDSFTRFRITNPLLTFQSANNENRAKILLEGIMQSSVRQVLAEQRMQTIVSGERAELMRRISTLTNEKAATLGVEVLDVRLKRVDLPRENSDSIFRRMRSERERIAAERRAEGQEIAITIRATADKDVAVIIAGAEKTSRIVRGEADARVTKVFAEAYGSDPEFFEFYRTMQAYRKSLGQNDTTLVLSPDSEFFKLFLGDKSRNN